MFARFVVLFYCSAIRREPLQRCYSGVHNEIQWDLGEVPWNVVDEEESVNVHVNASFQNTTGQNNRNIYYYM
jgi:hypothetical protein